MAAPTVDGSTIPRAAIERGAWALLASLLAALLISSLFYDRAGWPGYLAGEATYLMQARSLAEDFDLAYTRVDYDRMLLDTGNPTDLSLVSANEGRRITFDRPFPYALYLAPFIKVWPGHGFAFANALLLSLVSAFAARTFARQIGPWSALWVVVLIFGSVLFAYVFLATGDLFLFAVTLCAFCLIAGDSDGDVMAVSPRRNPKSGTGHAKSKRSRESTALSTASQRWLIAGILLAIPIATEPLYLVLLGAALFVGGHRATTLRPALVLGFLLGYVAQFIVGWWVGGGPEILGATHFRFTPETGFPLVDFTAGEWQQTVRRLSAMYWDEAPRFAWGVDLRLWGWDLIYLILGRSVGLLPYFAPLLLLAATSRAGQRRPLVLAAIGWGIGIVVLHPFNIYGGEGAVANRWFLPVYGAMWTLMAATGRKAQLAAVATLLLAAPFLWRLWFSPWQYPITGDQGYRHVTSVAQHLLPYETSQRWMPAGDMADHNGLMVKFLNPHGWAETLRGRLFFDASGSLDLLIGSMQPLDVLRFDFGQDAPGEIRVSGGQLAERVLQASGGISFRIEPHNWWRRHPMWWSPQPQWLYRLTLDIAPDSQQTDTSKNGAGRSLGFQLVGEQFEAP